MTNVSSTSEDGSPNHDNLFNEPIAMSDYDLQLITAYTNAGRTLDDLPYTGELESIYQAVSEGSEFLSRRDILVRLLNLRKAGKLPRIGRAKLPPPVLSDEQREILIRLVDEAIGSISLRDQLPHTEPFDGIVEQFNVQTNASFTPYQVWRVVQKLAK